MIEDGSRRFDGVRTYRTTSTVTFSPTRVPKSVMKRDAEAWRPMM